MAFTYNGSSTPSSSTTSYRVTGQSIARTHRDRRERAKLAADLADGTAYATPLTVKQAAALVGVPVLDVTRLRCNGKHSNGHVNGGEKPAEPVVDSSAVSGRWQKTYSPEEVETLLRSGAPLDDDDRVT